MAWTRSHSSTVAGVTSEHIRRDKNKTVLYSLDVMGPVVATPAFATICAKVTKLMTYYIAEEQRQLTTSTPPK